MGGFEDSDEEERMDILQEKLDLPLLLNKIDSLSEALNGRDKTDRNLTEASPCKTEPDIVKCPSYRKLETPRQVSDDDDEFLRQEILYSSLDKKSDKNNESFVDVSNFAREEEAARRRLLDEKDK